MASSSPPKVRLAAGRRKIQVAKSQLKMDDADYRQLLKRAAGVTSSTKIINLAQVDQVINEFRRLGFVDRPAARHGRVPNTLEREPQMQKIEALLADMGLSWGYAEAIARQQNPVGAGQRIERLEWVTDKGLTAVIAALEVEQKKRARLEGIDAALKRIGKTRTDVSAMLAKAGITDKWERNLKRLSFVSNALLVWWPK